MSTNRSRSRKESGKIAFCGLMVGLSVVLMLSGGLIPIATYCAPMAGGLLLLPILLEYGKKPAWTAYAATSLITLLLGADKEAAFFYLFLGYYPLLKWEIERIKNRRLHLPCKLLFFNLSVIIMYLILGFLFNMQAIIQEFTDMGGFLLIIFLITLNICMLLYDKLLFPMIYLYANKIKPRLRFLH